MFKQNYLIKFKNLFKIQEFLIFKQIFKKNIPTNKLRFNNQQDLGMREDKHMLYITWDLFIFFIRDNFIYILANLLNIKYIQVKILISNISSSNIQNIIFIHNNIFLINMILNITILPLNFVLIIIIPSKSIF